MKEEPEKPTDLCDYLRADARYLDDHRYESATCLYRYFGADDELLYVGITNDLMERDRAHWRCDEFYAYSLTMTVEVFPTRALAELAEDIAIHDEWPEFNRKRLPPVREKLEYPRYKWYVEQRDGKLNGEDPATLDLKASPEFWKPPAFQRQSENEA
ncbi:hypothetical protein [Roseovarius indicus]|uniref:GIY-YIG domain-containing protein n=1 Tax=Roseovarius indicus TaxID=540747 RepID=A0A5P3ABS6_9RHOB|nr:hypothetical protein [Roseovarius indicus]QEW26762.1 hypothetical protein RIdsm_02567 [Roseovarius indicus]SFD60466.1 hypothetical protein SAMN04488031_101776 [Roseovarius indicus]